jgi:phosphoglycolate phosphatase
MSLIVLDLDGTLIDSQRDLADSTNEMLESYGGTALPLDSVAAMVGEGARTLVARALTKAALEPDVDEALARFRAIYDRRLLQCTRPYSGVPEMMRDLAGHARLSVLTNKPEAPARRLLDAFGLSPLIADVVGGDSGFARKPDPAGLRHLIDVARSDPGSTLFVGDSMIDVETGRRAGVRVCVAMYGFGNLRGDLTLAGDELLAQQPADIVRLARRTMEPGVFRPRE